ncbi:SDR family NAD(P)-dependent oxidoreductase [Vulgatibacter sp.]|uniref:SDR family NAD(P)-dependent oxidoreductase n=1 Tax=Vulgatibacter sp. TaxID=1971226 RepID=UPI0035636F9F
MARDLQGVRAAITGASAGIGAATAAELAARGCDLVLGARRFERLDALRADIHRAHPDAKVEIHPLDVADAAQCEAFARAAGPVGILVNNAGLARGTDKVVDGHEHEWREMIETNVMGLLRITRLFLPGMIERRGGTVVNVGSVAGLEPYPGGAVYCATKASVRSITKALRHELLGTGVRVCNVEPGAVQTEFSEVRFRGDAARAEKVYQGFQPLLPEDVAEAIGFLVSRPAHVDVEELVLYPTAQASTMAFHKTA